jgi:hypothetical protein
VFANSEDPSSSGSSVGHGPTSHVFFLCMTTVEGSWSIMLHSFCGMIFQFGPGGLATIVR